MRPADRSRALQRRSRYETFEERLALTAQPLGETAFGLEQQLQHHYSELAPAPVVNPIGDFQLEKIEEERLTHHVDTVMGTSGGVHDLTGVNYVLNNFGFTGAGQTVAIIDSGIAWDHVALGGGFGTEYRVVGGYDFAEGDADPYDDGPSGFHGTHVAGIVGSSDAEHRGVASGVDLVGLRVFDDDGVGYFGWVEEALQWVHDHRNDYEHPITTVNLSLGSTWNADSVPAWATLEDEFAQLEAAGIFVAVSAGNSFNEYNEAGLSYPAASPYVVPVASIDMDGSISDFSQRSDRVLAAPGSYITSTIPDHVFGADGNPNDFGTSSGTSMASPYVAGASVLVRQAMEFAGFQGITQDTIYDHLRDTADLVYDSVTSASYHSINLEAAISALMPADDFGSTAGTAHSLGALGSSSSFAGVIGNVADADYFTFVASQTGQTTFSFDTTGELTLDAQVVGGSATFDGQTLKLDVVAGKSYTLALTTLDGVGHYSVNVSLAASSGSDTSGTDGSSKSGAGGEGEATVDPLAKAAYELDQAKELKFSGDDYLNWGGTNEKWLQGNDGWYFIRPNGEVYKWSGSGKANGTLVATLDAGYYADLSKLYDAQAPAASSGETSSGGTSSGSENTDGGAASDSGSKSSEGNTDGSGTGEDKSDSGSASGDESADGSGSSSDAESSLLRRARELDAKYGFRTDGNYYESWAGLGEKWFQSDELGWVFITPDGSVYDWNGSQAAAGSSAKVAQLDGSFHQDLTRLTDPPAEETGSDAGSENGSSDNDSKGDTSSGGAQDSGDQNQGDSGSKNDNTAGKTLAKRAYDLDQQLGLGSTGDYYHNWAKLGEKWMTSTSGQWYFITPDGSLYRWNGSQAGAASSELVAQLDATFHADPSKLHDAPVANSTVAVSGLRELSISDAMTVINTQAVNSILASVEYATQRQVVHDVVLAATVRSELAAEQVDAVTSHTDFFEAFDYNATNRYHVGAAVARSLAVNTDHETSIVDFVYEDIDDV